MKRKPKLAAWRNRSSATYPGVICKLWDRFPGVADYYMETKPQLRITSGQLFDAGVDEGDPTVVTAERVQYFNVEDEESDGRESVVHALLNGRIVVDAQVPAVPNDCKRFHVV